MDTRRLTTLLFPDKETCIIDVDHILKVAPRCCLKLFLDDSEGDIPEEIPITWCNLEEWQICLAAAEGLLDIYQYPNFVGIYHKYFGGRSMDLPRDQIVKEIGSCLTSVEKLATKESGMICVSEMIYTLAKDTASQQGLIPFQAITVNDLPFCICFDNGVPSDFGNGTLTNARRKLLEKLGNYNFHQPLYGDKYQKLIDEYRNREKGPRGAQDLSSPVPRGLSGNDRGPRGLPGRKGPINYHSNCILLGKAEGPQCPCMNYDSSSSECRDYYLEMLIDLSSSDEIRFIKAVFNCMVSQKTPKLVKRLGAIPIPRSSRDYSLSTEELNKTKLWPSQEALTTSLLDSGCVQLFLGFVKVKSN